MKSKKLLLVLASGLLVLAGCNGGKKPTPTPEPGPGPTPTPTPEPVAEAANGVFSYANSSNADRTEILGVLEKWAVDHKLTGMTIFEDGGYMMYNPDVEKGAPNYIKGYGFGTLSEGTLKAPLAGEEEEKYKNYYHFANSSDPGYMIYMNDDGSVVPSLVGYTSGGYYDIVMNATRTGYKWVGDLATNDEPVAVNPDSKTGAATIYRIPVKTGEALKYSTLSSNPQIAAFNNRPVALEDYILPYQLYYTTFYGMKRNAEIKDANSGSIKGGEAYAKASTEGFSEEAWKKIGIRSGHNEELGDYLEFELNKAETPFWARYYIGGSMFAPVPREFIELLGTLNGGTFEAGLKLWGAFSSDTNYSPVDTFLATGPYTLEEWKKDSKITWKRNPNYVYGTDRKTTRPSHYYIEGVYWSILKSLQTDPEAAFKEFLANKLHQTGIPSTKIKEYYDDPRATIVPGETTTKLNFNTCDQETWEELFGENGTIAQTPKSKYWKLKPAMQNKSFIDGMSFAVDRRAYAAQLGRTPSNNYFGSGYYSDPEEGIFYNDTEAHQKAVAESLEGTDGFGYSLEKAKACFKQAAQEMIDNGDYEVDDTIEIEMAWQAESNVDIFGKPIQKMIVDAFEAADTGLHLKFTNDYGADYTYVYYNKMMIGQFDIGFGGIEGNPYNPLNFMEVLKSDNSSNFTLNWGINTNEFVELEWDGKLWTYDALWECGDHGGYVVDGKSAPSAVIDSSASAVERLADGRLSVTTKYKGAKVLGEDNDEVLLDTTEISSICIYGKSTYGYLELYGYNDGTTSLTEFDEVTELPLPDSDSCEWNVSEADENGFVTLTVIFSADFVDAFLYYCPWDGAAYAGFDLYINKIMLGSDAEQYVGTFYEFDLEEAFPEIPVPNAE